MGAFRSLRNSRTGASRSRRRAAGVGISALGLLLLLLFASFVWAAPPEDVWDGTIATSFGGGSGSAGDPYLITNGAELAYLAQQVNAAPNNSPYLSGVYFRQTADIDLDHREWTPIGVFAGSSASANRLFSGTYDGDGYIVSNLEIDQTYTGDSNNRKAWALFSHLDGTVENLGVTGVDVYARNLQTTAGSTANAYTGGIAGFMTANGRIRNSYAEGSLTSVTAATGSSTFCAAGGVAARTTSATGVIVNSYGAVTATTTKGGSASTTHVGGLVGYSGGGTNPFATSYWDSTRTTEGVQGSASTPGVTGRTTADMHGEAFVTDLNNGRGTYKQWMADPASLNQGYPIHLREVGPTDISTATIAPIPDQTWTGSPIEPSVTVTLGGVTLVRDTDYTVAYSGNTAVGTATVTVTGTGNYSGQLQATFAIVAPQLTPLTVTATAADKVYDGTRTATVTLASADIAVGDQVTLSYGQAQFDTKHVGTAKTVTVSGITISGPDAGKYELQNTTATATAAVRPAPLTITAEDQTKLYKKTFVFTGSEFGAVGLVTGESVASVTLTSAGAAAGAAPGTYPIVPSAAQPGVDTDLGDYDIEYVDGVLTVSGGLKVAPFLKPLRQADARKFRRGATIRVAFRVKDANGKNTAAAKPVLTLKQGGTVLVKAKAVKYDKAKKLYIFQLKTKPGWKIAKYKLTVQLGAGSKGRSVFFRLTK